MVLIEEGAVCLGMEVKAEKRPVVLERESSPIDQNLSVWRRFRGVQ